MRSNTVFVLMTSIFILLFSMCSFSETFSRKTMVYALSHGEWPLHDTTQQISDEYNIKVLPVKTELNAVVLNDADILYLKMPKTEISAAERQAIQDFVRSDGALLIATDEERRQSIAINRVNDLLIPFGLMFTDDTPYVHNSSALTIKGDVLVKSWSCLIAAVGLSLAALQSLIF